MAPHPLSTADVYPAHIRFRLPPIIRTARLILRPATINDLPAIHGFLRNAETMKFMASKVSETIADSRHWFESRFVKDPVTGTGGGEFIYLISLRDGDNEGKAIGTIGSRQAPHLGYQIGAGSEYWGKGYASEAVGVIVAGICKTIQEEKLLDWEKAYIRIESENENVGSIKVAEKIGATKTSERIEEDEGGKMISEFRIWVKDWKET